MADRHALHLHPAQTRAGEVAPLTTKLLSFDVFGTLISVRDGSYEAFRSILADCGRSDVRVDHFWEYWEGRNIAHYWEPYRSYKEICELSLGEALAHFGIRGHPPPRETQVGSRQKLTPLSLCLPLVDDGPQCCGGDSSYNEPRAPACPCQEVTHCYSPFTCCAHKYPSSSLIRLRFRIA